MPQERRSNNVGKANYPLPGRAKTVGVVKGVNFINLRDAGDPVEQARVYDRMGADELVFLDITASHEQREIVTQMVRRVADEVFLPFTVGGGIRTADDMWAILRAGADKISINSAAVKNPFGPDRRS